MEPGKVGGQSISKTFNRALLIVYVLSVALSLPFTWFLTKREVFGQANKDLKLLVDMVGAVRGVVKEDTRPYFIAKGEFLPVVVSSTVMAKTVATKFKKVQGDYLIRMVSDNPLNPEDLPDDLETEVLTTLRSAPTQPGLQQIGNIRGQDYLISASATKAEESCMLCHGDPAKAPASITTKYGSKSGFGWHDGDIVGASLVGVPLVNTNLVVLTRSAIIFGIITAVFAVIVILLNGIVRKSIIRPITDITKAAIAVSRGKANEPLTSNRRDEIGTLVHAFELMRRSINLATEHITKLRKKQGP